MSKQRCFLFFFIIFFFFLNSEKRSFLFCSFLFFFERRYLRLKEHPVILLGTPYIRIHCSWFSGKSFGSYVTNFRRRDNPASRMVHRPIRLGSRNSARLFRGLREELRPLRVCVHGGHGRPYGVACCGHQTVQQQSGPPLSTCIVRASRPIPRAYRWFHTNSWLRGISWEPLGLRSFPIARGCRVSGTNLHAPSVERCPFRWCDGPLFFARRINTFNTAVSYGCAYFMRCPYGPPSIHRAHFCEISVFRCCWTYYLRTRELEANWRSVWFRCLNLMLTTHMQSLCMAGSS